MLPPDVSAHVTMHMELPQYATYGALKAFALKYVKVMQGISATRKRTSRFALMRPGGSCAAVGR